MRSTLSHARANLRQVKANPTRSGSRSACRDFSSKQASVMSVARSIGNCRAFSSVFPRRSATAVDPLHGVRQGATEAEHNARDSRPSQTACAYPSLVIASLHDLSFDESVYGRANPCVYAEVETSIDYNLTTEVKSARSTADHIFSSDQL